MINTIDHLDSFHRPIPLGHRRTVLPLTAKMFFAGPRLVLHHD